MVRPTSENPRNRSINLRLKRSELEAIEYVSDALGVSRTDAIVLSVKYLITAAKARYKRKGGGYTGMRFRTLEEVGEAKKAELEEWRQSVRQREYEALEAKLRENFDDFDFADDSELSDYIDRQKEEIETHIEEQSSDVEDRINEEYEKYIEEIEAAKEDLKSSIHRLIFGE